MANFETIAAKHDGFITDLWGVVHDGTSLYPGAAETIAWLHAQKKPVVFLSNAPRVAAKAIAILTKMGIPREHYIDVVTSGQVAHDWLRDAKPYGPRYFYLGPGKDEDVLDGLSTYQRVTSLVEADFVLNTGYQYDLQPDAEIMPLIKRLAGDSRPFLCVNPDREVVKQDGTEIGCAGRVAALFEAEGGKVTYIGKPYTKVYDACRKLLPKGRLLAIGDNLLTDIRGGNDARIDTLLITGGVLKVVHKRVLDLAEALSVCKQTGVMAKYVLPSFTLGE